MNPVLTSAVYGDDIKWKRETDRSISAAITAILAVADPCSLVPILLMLMQIAVRFSLILRLPYLLRKVCTMHCVMERVVNQALDWRE